MKLVLPRRSGLVLTLLCLLTLPLRSNAAPPTPYQSADPLVGTDAHGHTYPGATVPFGMVQLSPDTRTDGWDGSSGYHYDDTTIDGFSHTHLTGTGVGDLGDLLLMPTVGPVHLDLGTPGNGYISRFSHNLEVARPGYYKVYLQDPKVTAELTATARCGFHQYTFPASDQSHVILDLNHGIGNTVTGAQVDFENDHTISGSKTSNGWAYHRTIYFVMEFSKPFAAYGISDGAQPVPEGTPTAQGKDIRAFVTYHTTADEAIRVKVGISATSIEGARKNLNTEIPGWDFAAVHAAAVKQWTKTLGAVQIETPDVHVRRTFYTNLYETCLAPVLFNDVDGTYLGMDHKVHPGAGFQNYTEFSLWDIYRAEVPLLTILQPGRVSDMSQALLAEYQQNGLHSTPIWPLWDSETFCMIGYHAAPMMVDTYLKGLDPKNAEAVYQAIRDTAMQDRSGLATYKTLGYVASRQGEQATSKTLEYAYDDWCIARLAQKLGHTADAELFYQRSANYRDLFDRTVGFMRGRKADGSWRAPFISNGLVGDEYTEADAWQYAFHVQQDVPGLIKLYGGDTGFIQKMDEMFAASSKIHTGIPDISGLIGQYSQGDEQCHHVAYLYDYAGAPWKTQQRVRQVMATLYNDTPSGQCGNNDCGQMAAWYVFSALGFYPVNPASGVYVLGSPAVSKAVLHLDPQHYGGHTFTVIAQNNSAKNIYIQSATLNGKPLRGTWLTHTQLTTGGTLKLVMGPKPNTQWGHSAAARPPSEMPAGFHYAALPTPSAPWHPVPLSLPIRVACGVDDPIGNFVPDPNMTDGDTNGASTDIDTSVPDAAPAGVYQSERYAQDFTYMFPVPKDGAYTVRLHFAEIFDSGVGERLENIAINGKPVLTNFDIITAAGGTARAVVKTFSDIQPDAKGNIAIRISAAPNSPDQNAKINGIEILPQQSTGSD